MSRLLIVLITAVLGTGSPQVAGGTLEGMVVDRSSGRPIAGAVVELTGLVTSQTGPRDWRVRSFSTVTGVNGEFLLTGVPPGTAYQLVATRSPDFLPGVHGQQQPDDAWIPIAMTAGQQLKGLLLRLSALSSISGRVLDSQGKPEKDERVMALMVRYRDGHRVFESETSAYTDSQGNYRIGGLHPGRYVVRIRPEIRVSSRVSTRGSEAASLYFPNTLDPNEPEEIHVDGITSIENVNFVMAEMRLRRVQGVVSDAETGKTISTARVFLVPALATPDSSLAGEFISRNGQFDFREVVPGQYTLFAVADGPNASMSGRAPISVQSTDPLPITLQLHRDVDLDGLITVDAPALASTLDFSQISITATPRSLATVDVTQYAGVMADDRRQAVTPVQVTPSRSGAFRLRGLRAWPYFADALVEPGRNAAQQLSTAYVKSIHLGSDDLLIDAKPVVPAAGAALRIVLGTDAGTLDGRVVDADGHAMPYAVVVLVPDEPRRNRRDLYRTTRADPGGRFSIPGIAPGSYKVFTWRTADSGAWFNSEFLRPYESRAFPVVLGPSETKSAGALVLSSPRD